MRKWEGFGWLVGTIETVNVDKRRKIDGDHVNFFIQYDGEEDSGPVPHLLEVGEYRTEDDADYDSWPLLEATEATAEPMEE